MDKSIPSRKPWRHLIRDAKTGIYYATTGFRFIKEHRLWTGMAQYRWLSIVLVVMALLIGLRFAHFLSSWWTQPELAEQGVMESTMGLFSTSWLAVKDFFFDGSYPYLVLVLIEVLIFHFVRRTLMIVTGQTIDTRFKTFLSSQMRMISLGVVSFVLDAVFTFLLNLPLGILGLSVLKPIATQGVQAFFMGVIIVDNYNEVYHMTIRQSLAYCWQYGGLTIIVGALVSILILAPLVGVIIGPILGAVVAARTLHSLYLKDYDREWVFLRYPKE